MLRVALVGDSHLTDVSPRPVTKLGPPPRSAGFEVVTLARGGLDLNDTAYTTMAELVTDIFRPTS